MKYLKPKSIVTLVFVISISIFFTACTSQKKAPADLILTNAEIYTLDEEQPWAQTVVITGNIITAVLDEKSDYESYIGENTRVIDLEGKFVVPGFIDAHTHFDGFGKLQNDPDLMPVSDDEGLIKEIKRVVDILPEGEWITGGAWDGHRLWNADWREREALKENRWEPDRVTIDDITRNNPCFLSSWDRELYLANTAALKAAGLENAKLKGMKLKDGKPTGLIYAGSPAIDIIRKEIAPKSEERILNEMRAGLKKLAEQGIVEIHDITDRGTPEHYAKLHANGELTCRVWMRLDLSRSPEIKSRGIKMNTHPVTGERDYFLRYGAFKGYMDGLMGSHGALLFEPYTDDPDTYGHYRDHSSDDPPGYKIPNLEKMYNLLKAGAEAGFVTNTHAIGDKGISLTLDLFERLGQEFGAEAVARSRVIHAQTMVEENFQRFKNLNVIAEVNPSNVEDDMRWIIRRLGPEREKLSHPFKKFLENDVVIIGGSDIPGAQGATFKCHPSAMINAVVNRTKNDSTPEGGWLPEFKLTVHEAIKMHTLDAAYAVFDEDVRGSIQVGKFADIVVCDRNLMKIDPKDILNMNIAMTIVDGQIVFQ